MGKAVYRKTMTKRTRYGNSTEKKKVIDFGFQIVDDF